MSQLAIDIGNTRIKCALFERDQLQQHFIFDETEAVEKLQGLYANNSIENGIYSTVADVPEEMQVFFEKQGIIQITHELNFPFEIRYKTPHTLGRDRIAGIAGAWQQFPNESSLVIDAGTCIKYDLIDAMGNYLGGNISPGITMRLKAMHTFTDKLPMTSISDSLMLYGIDTVSAIQTGGLRGALLELEGFIQTYTEQWPHLNIILTGGDADFFAKHLNTKIFVRPNILLEGLNEILKYNVA